MKKSIAILLISLLLLTMFIGTSCSESKKIAKAKLTLLFHPSDAADFCADNFGCPVISVDSSGEIAAKKTADSLLQALEVERLKENPELEQLKAEIARLAGIAPADCDSLSEAIYRYCAKEKARADRAEATASQLRQTLNNQKPRIESVKDVARERQLEFQLKESQATIDKKNTEITTLESDLKAMKKNRNWWRIACLISWAAIAGYGVLKFKRII